MERVPEFRPAVFRRLMSSLDADGRSVLERALGEIENGALASDDVASLPIGRPAAWDLYVVAIFEKGFYTYHFRRFTGDDPGLLAPKEAMKLLGSGLPSRREWRRFEERQPEFDRSPVDTVAMLAVARDAAGTVGLARFWRRPDIPLGEAKRCLTAIQTAQEDIASRKN